MIFQVLTLWIYFQVDIHVCMDKDEWDRIMFYNSYGDLGMILGLIGKNAGLSLGSKGLKVCPPCPQHVQKLTKSTSFLIPHTRRLI